MTSQKSLFKFINAEMTPTPPKRRERSERAKSLELFDFVYVTFVVFLDENWTF